MIDNAKKMIENAKFWAKVAVADRKGATAIEYALIAAAAAAVVLIGFQAFFNRITSYLNAISFTGATTAS